MRVEKSRSNLEIVYGNVTPSGEVTIEIGLPDGSIISYEEYCRNFHDIIRGNTTVITPDTPSAADPVFTKVRSSMAVLYYAATLAVILVIILHAI